MRKIYVTLIALMATLAVNAQTSNEYVDLGLPSGTLWATCNLGAEAPEELGDYYAWGETEPNKEKFNWGDYKWCNGSATTLTKYCLFYEFGTPDHKQVLDKKDDAAISNLGKEWCMPTDRQISELINKNNTTTEFTTLNGVNGILLTSKKNGNSIFLPAAGSVANGVRLGKGLDGCYWSTSGCNGSADALKFYVDTKMIVNAGQLCDWGVSIRPVRSKKAVTTSINGVVANQEAAKDGKYIIDGRLVIVKDGKQYNAQGINTK